MAGNTFKNLPKPFAFNYCFKKDYFFNQLLVKSQSL